MKWIRCDDGVCFEFRSDKPVEGNEDWYQCLSDEYVVCEKHDDWREIESGTLNIEDGRWHITLKPLPTPEKVPTLVEAAKRHLEADWETYRSYGLEGLRGLGQGTVILGCAVQLAEAIEREEKKPANPYTKEAVDELLDALSHSHERLVKSECEYNFENSTRSWDAVQALLRQREAANVQ